MSLELSVNGNSKTFRAIYISCHHQLLSCCSSVDQTCCCTGWGSGWRTTMTELMHYWAETRLWAVYSALSLGVFCQRANKTEIRNAKHSPIYGLKVRLCLSCHCSSMRMCLQTRQGQTTTISTLRASIVESRSVIDTNSIVLTACVKSLVTVNIFTYRPTGRS
jgi:hypothetical protein